MYVLTDGKSYVMENPLQQGAYISTTSPVQAKLFTYKQARSLIQNKKKSLSWIKKYYMLNQENGQVCNTSPYYNGNEGVYMGENDIDFNENIINEIYQETSSLIGLAGWSLTQLETYNEQLTIGLSKYDSAEADIEHALQRYRDKNDGKKPQAHKMAKVGYLLDEIRDKHKHIKQCKRYVEVMKDAINHSYTVEKLKLELTKAQNVEYKGRTEYYEMALRMLG